MLRARSFIKKTFLKNKLYLRFSYGVIAFLSVLSFGLITPRVAHAGLFDLIFNGIQVLQISNMSDRQEMDLGRRINDQLLGSGEFRLYNDPQVSAYINDIGQRLVPHSDRPNLTYTFQVVDDDSVNAFATMGGFTYYTTGLLKAADNESEIAGVMGHELGHIAARDSLNQMKQAAIAQGIAGAVGLGSDEMVNLGVQVALHLPASRSAEYAADNHGFDTIGEAGYDQTGMVSFMQKLVREGSPPEFLSTHPDARNRVNSLQSMDNSSAIASSVDGTNTSSYNTRIASLR